MLKKSASLAAWAMMANMPLRLKAEVAIKMLLAGSDEQKRRDNARCRRETQADGAKRQDTVASEHRSEGLQTVQNMSEFLSKGRLFGRERWIHRGHSSS